MTKKQINEHLLKNATEVEYKADKLTKEGYGQTIGGYHETARKKGIRKEEPLSQKWHFTVSYYEYMKNIDTKPTYSQLKCPELLIWIAEVTGLKDSLIDEAIALVKDFEDKNHSVGQKKGADYFAPIIGELKKTLHIQEINRVLGDALNWEEASAKVRLIGVLEKES